MTTQSMDRYSIKDTYLHKKKYFLLHVLLLYRRSDFKNFYYLFFEQVHYRKFVLYLVTQQSKY